MFFCFFKINQYKFNPNNNCCHYCTGKNIPSPHLKCEFGPEAEFFKIEVGTDQKNLTPINNRLILKIFQNLLEYILYILRYLSLSP